MNWVIITRVTPITPQVLAWFPIQRTIITKYLRSMYTITSYAQHLRFHTPRCATLP